MFSISPILSCFSQYLRRAVDLNKLTSRVHVLELENTQLRVRNKQLEKEVSHHSMLAAPSAFIISMSFLLLVFYRLWCFSLRILYLSKVPSFRI